MKGWGATEIVIIVIWASASLFGGVTYMAKTDQEVGVASWNLPWYATPLIILAWVLVTAGIGYYLFAR